MGSLENKIALITGASRGIGYHSALTLAREGAHVIAVARTIGGLEELDDEIQKSGGSATLVPLDLMDFDGIDRLGASIHERWGKLDIFVASAGTLGGLSPLEHFEPRTFEKVMALNVTANWRLACSVSPLLHEAQGGRAILLTGSEIAKDKPFWAPYAMSQASLNAMVKAWAAETAKTGLKINLLDPGPMRTALRAQAMPGEDKESLAHPSEIADAILALTAENLSESGGLYLRQSAQFVT